MVVVFDGAGVVGSQPTAARLKTANMHTNFFIVALQLIQWVRLDICGMPARER